MKKVAIQTLGCKVNAYDSDCMQALFLHHGFEQTPFGQPADIVVVNTCTVTATADKKSRAAIRRAAKTGRVIVAGCMAQKDAQRMLGIEGVGAVVGTDGRADIVVVAQRLLAGEDKIDATHSLKGCGFEPLSAGLSGARTRGVLKIQEGCDNFCSYCIIPYVRGRSRSRDLNDIVREAEAMARSGIREIVLTGIHIADYHSGGLGLSDVIAALDPLGVRVRLGSVEPGVLGEAFAQAAARAKNLCPHFHISLQSGSASVLARMNRKYSPAEYMAFVDALRRHFDEPAITTDIIAGFPGETDAQQSETMRFVEQAGFARVHVFPFSAREGTAAFDMKPKVPKAVAKARAAELIALGAQSEAAYLHRMIGRVEQVLFEEPSAAFPGKMEGYSARYFRVAADAQRNEVRDVALADICDTIMLGNKV